MRINPRQLEKMAKRMGIQAVPIEAEEVIIRTPDKDLVVRNPQVSKVNMMGQETLQITGEIVEQPRASAEPFTEEDIKTVMDQTGASEEEAKQALEETNGDLAQSILKLKKE